MRPGRLPFLRRKVLKFECIPEAAPFLVFLRNNQLHAFLDHAFQVASATDSRVILGESGAEQLLGNGDMLFHRPGAPDARRIQGCFVDDGEVQRVAEALRRQGSPSYVSGVTEGAETADEDGESSVGGRGRKSGEKDPLYDEAVQVVLTEKRASISLVQRHLAIGYNRAANILEAMEAAGLVSKPNAMGKRTTLVPDREL